jgi:alpha-ketoglutarate-dependent 2,4-dichlorophenoxyacetate dioxygenase
MTRVVQRTSNLRAAKAVDQLDIRPLHPMLAAEVRGVDLSVPLDDELRGRIEDAFAEYTVLVFPDQTLTLDAFVDFAHCFGEPEGSAFKDFVTDGNEGAVLLSNLDENGDVMRESDPRAKALRLVRDWHTDSSYRLVPAKASFLYAQRIPSWGGETCFVSMRVAYDELDDAMRNRIEDLAAVHDYRKQIVELGGYDPPEVRAAYPPVVHPIVRIHAPTGRKAVYVGAHAAAVVGFDREEGRRLIDELIERATSPDHVYAHRWRPKDVVMWDNRCAMHRVNPHAAEPRVLLRTSVRDDAYVGVLA